MILLISQATPTKSIIYITKSTDSQSRRNITKQKRLTKNSTKKLDVWQIFFNSTKRLDVSYHGMSRSNVMRQCSRRPGGNLPRNCLGKHTQATVIYSLRIIYSCAQYKRYRNSEERPVSLYHSQFRLLWCWSLRHE